MSIWWYMHLPFDIRPDDLDVETPLSMVPNFCTFRWRGRSPTVCEREQGRTIVEYVRKRLLQEVFNTMRSWKRLEQVKLQCDDAKEWENEFLPLMEVVKDLESDNDAKLIFLATHPHAGNLVRCVMWLMTVCKAQEALIEKKERKEETEDKEKATSASGTRTLPLLFGPRTAREWREHLERWAQELRWHGLWTVYYKNEFGW